MFVRLRLFEELTLCHADGSFRKRLAAIAKINVLIIDDFAIAPIGPRERNDLLELIDDRVGTRSCIVTSQLPIEDWHDYIGDPTLADAILDRLLHRSHRIHLEAKESIRKTEGGRGICQGAYKKRHQIMPRLATRRYGASAADAADCFFALHHEKDAQPARWQNPGLRPTIIS